MNISERNQIAAALDSGDVKNINITCRKILQNRLQWDEQPDRNLRFLLDGIVKEFDFPLNYRINEGSISKTLTTNRDIKKIIFGILVMLIGIYLCTYDSTLVRVIGGCISGIAGLFINFSKKDKNEVVKVPAKLEISDTPESLLEYIDALHLSLSKFYKYRQLEGRQIKILLWFQNFYSEDISEKSKQNIQKLLYQYGYRLTEFTPEISSDFEIYPGNVDEPKTTMPAIINEDGDCVCKGMVVIPKL